MTDQKPHWKDPNQQQVQAFVSKDLHKRLKIAAAVRETTIQQAIVEAIMLWLEKGE